MIDDDDDDYYYCSHGWAQKFNDDYSENPHRIPSNLHLRVCRNRGSQHPWVSILKWSNGLIAKIY
jgi:hypothetical protein